MRTDPKPKYWYWRTDPPNIQEQMFGVFQQTGPQQRQGGSHREASRTGVLILLAQPLVWETGLVPQQAAGSGWCKPQVIFTPGGAASVPTLRTYSTSNSALNKNEKRKSFKPNGKKISPKIKWQRREHLVDVTAAVLETHSVNSGTGSQRWGIGRIHCMHVSH